VRRQITMFDAVCDDAVALFQPPRLRASFVNLAMRSSDLPVIVFMKGMLPSGLEMHDCCDRDNRHRFAYYS